MGRAVRFSLAPSLPTQVLEVLVKDKENKGSRRPTNMELITLNEAKGSSYKLSSHSPDHLHLFSIHLPKMNQFLGWKQIIRFIYDYFITFNQMFLYFILLLLHKVLLGTIFFTVLSNLIYSLGGVWKEVSIQIKFGSDLYWELQATLV